jgi:hypothetical protein
MPWNNWRHVFFLKIFLSCWNIHILKNVCSKVYINARLDGKGNNICMYVAITRAWFSTLYGSFDSRTSNFQLMMALINRLADNTVPLIISSVSTWIYRGALGLSWKCGWHRGEGEETGWDRGRRRHGSCALRWRLKWDCGLRKPGRNLVSQQKLTIVHFNKNVYFASLNYRKI